MSDSQKETFGWNDPDGTIHCGFCDWTKKCNSLEHIEHELKRHLQEVHNKVLRYRIDDETGDRRDIP